MISWSLGAAFAGGLFLGFINFSLLRATTVRILETRRPFLLAMGSFFSRSAAILACFFLLAGGLGGKLAAAMGGLLLARGFVLRCTTRGDKATPALTRRMKKA
jgi:F1F0 ATPase subunit 2